MTKSSIAVLVVTLVFAAACHPARAQYFMQSGGSSSPAAGNIEGFTVTGKGLVSAKPNRMEIDLEVSAASELTADAIVKYRDTKRRLQEAFTALKLANIAVEERGLLVDQKGTQMNPYFFDGMPNKKGKAEVQLTRKLVVTCTDIRKLDEETLLQLVAKLLDVAQDAGGRVGRAEMDFNPYFMNRFDNSSNGLVRFILDDFDKLEDDAYAMAIADAEARAGRLAKLSRVKLGPVTSAREISSPVATIQDDEPAHKRLTSSRFQDIPVRVELLVRFDVAPAAGTTNGRAGGP